MAAAARHEQMNFSRSSCKAPTPAPQSLIGKQHIINAIHIQKTSRSFACFSYCHDHDALALLRASAAHILRVFEADSL
jgi:hypothetical protein